MAQSNVYSLNVVGYYNVTVAANTYTMIANQLNTTNNFLSTLIPNGPPFAQFFKFVNGAWVTSGFDDVDLAWEPTNPSLNPGEAGLYKSPSAVTLTFVGEVEQGALVNPLPVSQAIARSSMVPQAGKVTTDLGFPGYPFDQVFKWTGNSWVASAFDDVDLIWEPTEPTFGVGEGFLVKKAAASTATTWTRNFTVQ